MSESTHKGVVQNRKQKQQDCDQQQNASSIGNGSQRTVAEGISGRIGLWRIVSCVLVATYGAVWLRITSVVNDAQALPAGFSLG